MKITNKLAYHIPLIALLIGPMAESQAAQSRISILYTNKAKNRNGGDAQIKSRIFRRVQVTNRVSRNSKTNFSLKVGRSRRVGYNESGLTLLGNLNDLKGGGSSQNEKNLRNDARREEREKKSDLVSLISTERGGGGVSSAVGWANRPGFYSAINADFLGNSQNMPHELGHNFNGDHSKANRMATDIGQVHTVMWSSLQSKWAEHYSNPNVKFRSRFRTGSNNKNNSSPMRARDPINARRIR